MQKYNVNDKVVFKMNYGSDTYVEQWSGIISNIHNNWYNIKIDGVIIPEITRKNLHFNYPDINLHFYQDALISPYIDKEGDDERRRNWPEVNAARNVQIQILKKQIDEETEQFNDKLFAKFQIGDMVDYVDDSEDFPQGGACGGIICFSGTITNLDRENMLVVVKTNNTFEERFGDIRYLNKI
jgi:hypothetical protein